MRHILNKHRTSLSLIALLILTASLYFFFQVQAAVNPSATDVALIGTPFVGENLTGSYTFVPGVPADPEGVSTYKWYRDDVEISGATGITYTLTSDDNGHAIKFEVTPVSNTSAAGDPVQSAPSDTVTVLDMPPQADGCPAFDFYPDVLPVASTDSDYFAQIWADELKGNVHYSVQYDIIAGSMDNQPLSFTPSSGGLSENTADEGSIDLSGHTLAGTNTHEHFWIKATDADNSDCFGYKEYNLYVGQAPTVTALTVDPNPWTVAAGTTFKFNAMPTPANGEFADPVNWDTTDAGVATVDSDGNVTGIAPGTATITATSGSLTDGAVVTVVPLMSALASVTPDNPTIYTADPDNTAELTANLPSPDAVYPFDMSIQDTNNQSRSIFSRNISGTDGLRVSFRPVGQLNPAVNAASLLGPTDNTNYGAHDIPRLLSYDSAADIERRLNSHLKPIWRHKVRFIVNDPQPRGVQGDDNGNIYNIHIVGNIGYGDNADMSMTGAVNWSSADDAIAPVAADARLTSTVTGASAGDADITAAPAGAAIQMLVFNDFEQRFSTSRSTGAPDSAFTTAHVLEHPPEIGGGASAPTPIPVPTPIPLPAPVIPSKPVVPAPIPTPTPAPPRITIPPPTGLCLFGFDCGPKRSILPPIGLCILGIDCGPFESIITAPSGLCIFGFDCQNTQ